MLRARIHILLLGLFMAFPVHAENLVKAPTIHDSGNTAWILISAALVMLMTPGLAFFYAGMVSRKNVVSTLLQNYAAIGLVGIIWIVIGYSLVYTEGNPFIGNLDAFMLRGLAGKLHTEGNIPSYAFMVFQMMFAIITPALITGAFAERVRFKAWILILGLWNLLVYVPVAHWIWGPKGWLADMGGLDFAGGLVVHVTAGFSGLVAAFLFGRRYNSEYSQPSDIPMIMLGAALLWFGWYGFNAGSAISSNFIAAHAFLLTFVGGAVSFLTWMLVDWICNGKPSAIGASVGLVVGLVCITPAAGYVELENGMFMCFMASIICNISARYVKKISGMDDALDVFTCHGISGVVGAIFTGFFASKAINPEVLVEGLWIKGETKLFLANLFGVLVVALYSMVMTYIIIKFIDIFTHVRASSFEQDSGLDNTMHGENSRTV